MSNFKLKIKGLKELQKDVDLSSRPFSSQEEHIAKLVMDFHYALAMRTSEIFNTPYGLSEVLIGKTLMRERFGKSLSRFGLQYRDKPIKLKEFPFTVKRSTATSSAPLRLKSGAVLWMPGQWSSDVLVSVRKGKGRIERRFGNNVFEIGRGNTQAGSGDLGVRMQQATWNEFPTYDNPGVRAYPLATPYGPSLASMANGVFNKDAAIKRKYAKLAKEIENSYLNYYLNE